MPVSEPLPHFVDDLLGYLHETHPTHATLDGVHAHDDLLEDLSRSAIEAEARALAGYLRRLDEIEPDGSPRSSGSSTGCWRATSAPACSSSRRSAPGRSNPQFYADVVASSLAAQALFTHAPAPERARRVLSKLRQTPGWCRRPATTSRIRPASSSRSASRRSAARSTSSSDDLPRAFSSVDDMHLLGDLADAQTEASQAIGAYVQYLETEMAPRGARLVPAGPRPVRAEAPARRGLRWPPTGCWRSPCAS